MKKLMLVIALIAIFAVSAWAQSRAERRGIEPYTPTKLEWLCVELNSRYGLDGTTGIGRYFLADERSDAVITVTASVRGANRTLVNETAEQGRRVVSMVAKARGWHWVVVREKIEMLE
jgi:hypothetical protein